VCLVIGVGNVVPVLWLLAGDLTYARHDATPLIRKRRDSTPFFGNSQPTHRISAYTNQSLAIDRVSGPDERPAAGKAPGRRLAAVAGLG
jgi:hypothetical protein